MSLVALTAISKRYHMGEVPVHALRRISLQVAKGESVAIMGPSGSGKSTLLGILGCLEIPSGGSYQLAGEEIGRMSPAELAELRCRSFGFVFQNFSLLPRLTAVENVELPLAYGRVPPAERKVRALEMLERVGLGDRVRHYPSQLSGGQQQRVAIARALVNRPDLILADEPTGALDTSTGREILVLLDEVNAEGTTVIVVTHDPSIAANMRRTIRLADGAILSDEARELETGREPARRVAS